jgi:hypothetical protein
MSIVDAASFQRVLLAKNKVGDLKGEVLRHEMSATLNRSSLTQKEEATNTFTTAQLCWLVASNPQWNNTQPLYRALLLSAIIEDDIELFNAAKRCGVIPEEWTWVAWADGFGGDEDMLLTQLRTINDMSQRCAAACLATRMNVKAISNQLLLDMCQDSLANVYHCLLKRSLQGPQAARNARNALYAMGAHLEVLFASDTDATIAMLVAKSDLDHPEELITVFADATSDLTCTAIASRHLERGRAAMAYAMVKDLRFLSVAYDQAIVVAALACLECGDLNQASLFVPSIPDRQLRLKVQTRLAQASGDSRAELEALVALNQLCPRDGQIFIQLVNLLDRTKNTGLARQICFQAQERFVDDPLVLAVIKRHAVASE